MARWGRRGEEGGRKKKGVELLSEASKQHKDLLLEKADNYYTWTSIEFEFGRVSVGALGAA